MNLNSLVYPISLFPDILEFGLLFFGRPRKYYNHFYSLVDRVLQMAESKDQSADDIKTVHLVSQEGESFDVPLSVGKMSVRKLRSLANNNDGNIFQGFNVNK